MDIMKDDYTLGFDYRFLFVYAVVMYLNEYATSLPVMLVSTIIPGGNYTREAGYSSVYTQFYPLVLLTELIFTAIIIGIISYKIDYRRSYMFKAQIEKKATILEQLTASGLVFVFWMIPLVNTGKINYIPTLIGSITAYLFGFIDKTTSTENVFVTEVGGEHTFNGDTIWIALISIVLTLILYNVIMYLTRKKGTFDGYTKRKKETEDLYREHEKRIKNS